MAVRDGEIYILQARSITTEDFNCYCFAARSWNEDPDRFIRTLRPMLKSEQIEDLSVEGGKRNVRLQKPTGINVW